ncbi:MAG TPA: protease pro-enzyme activation domain-containing protein, partial [Verrucomicrobiae bacterium]
QVYDPASANYHHFLTTEEFTAQFGPTEQDYAMVANFARVNGLTVTHTHANRMLLDVSGRAANIEKAFQVNLRTYQHPKENRKFFAPDADPSVDVALPILSVSGLDNYSIPHPKSRPQPLNQASVAPKLGSGHLGSYQGNDFRNAYVPGTTLTGAGQNVGLLQFDGFFPSDITAYENQIGLITNVPQLIVVPIDGGVPVPTRLGNSEVSLDIEMVVSMAPGVSKIYVYEAPNPSPWVDLLNRMANDNLARQLSCSWGGGPPVAAAEQIFQQMALQGQTFLNASGDSDAFNAVSNPIQFPSDSPHITEVGGTFLTTGANASYASETVWNRDVQIGPVWDGVGSCGGISTFYSIPSWQTNINFTASQGSSTFRNVPDVALTAENVWVIYGGGQSGAFGGTSCAAPLWAGFMALVNQQATNNGHASIGFLNPAIYNIAKSAAYTNCFHDTTTGNNTWSGSPTLFYATNNYDLVTGLGTPNGTNLINALTLSGVTNPIIHYSPPPPPYGSTLATMNGGNPNGTWQLFVLDDAAFNSGIISNGWILALTTATPVGFSANLNLAMTASVTTVLVSNNFNYTLTVTNNGPSTSSNVLVSDTLPLNLNVVSSSAGQGSVLRSGQLLNWNVGTLAVNAGSQLAFTVRPDSYGDMFNYATASAATSDANTDDKFASVNVTVIVATPPQISGIFTSTNGAFQLTVLSPAVPTVIQASTNLVNWVNIYTNTPPFTFTDSNATSYKSRFYRALVGL